MTGSDDSPVRAGSSQDLSRRMDGLERNHESLAREVTTLSGTVARVEQNQTHAAELNKLRFDSLDTGLNAVKASLDTFMGRINGLITGEVKLPASEKMMADYLAWRTEVNDRLEKGERADLTAAAKKTGVVEALGAGRSIVLFGLAAAGAVITTIEFLSKLQVAH